jgi:hypothetical protein
MLRATITVSWCSSHFMMEIIILFLLIDLERRLMRESTHVIGGDNHLINNSQCQGLFNIFIYFLFLLQTKP